MNIVEKVSHYPGSLKAWITSRGAALLHALDRRGISQDRSFDITRGLLAHWWNETGGGIHEWNYNLGNIKAHAGAVPDAAGSYGWHGDAMYLTSAVDGREAYRSYDTAEDGIEDYLQAMEHNHRYQAAWIYLVSTGDVHEWFRQLTWTGYLGQMTQEHSNASLAGFDSIVRRMLNN